MKIGREREVVKPECLALILELCSKDFKLTAEERKRLDRYCLTAAEQRYKCYRDTRPLWKRIMESVIIAICGGIIGAFTVHIIAEILL